MKRIATHRKPDADALVSAWLARRFLLAGREPSVDFVGRSFRDEQPGSHDAVVDVGCRYDPFALRFDHKPPAVRDRHSTCATRMVWEHLLANGWPLLGLAGLIDAIHDGDSAKRRARSAAYRQSRQEGLHARVAEIQQAHPNDRELYIHVESWLNLYVEKHCGPVERSDTSDPQQQLERLVRYGRGRVYLSTLEADRWEYMPASNPRRYPAKCPALSKWDKRSAVAGRLSEQFQCDPKQLRADAAWAFALDTLAEQVDAQVRTELLAPDCILSEEIIQSIARSAPPRMRFAIEQFRSGCRRPLNVKTEVFDTVAFTEIMSRIARADGSVRATLAQWDERLSEAQRQQLQLVDSAVKDVTRALDECPCISADPPAVESKVSKSQSTPKRGTRNQLNAARAFLDKCARDVPRLPRKLRPTPAESSRCLERLHSLSALISQSY